jgi:quercetin dioxygenase-like cupin family protein
MTVERGRIGDTPAPASGEDFHTLAGIGGVRIEEIVSSATPDTGVQVQDHDEWVVLVAGAAVLDVDGAPVELRAGDWILLPAGRPHRVLRTAAGTRWLALHAPV